MAFLFRPSLVPRLPFLILAGILACSPRSSIAQEKAEDGAKSWTSTLEMIRARFPAVAQVPTDTLQVWLKGSPKRKDLILLDVRKPDEYAVSHLLGARLAPSKDEALNVLRDVPADQCIVVYCSVGYRSSELAEILMKTGFTEVYNLEGSIFRWANEGRPVYRAEKRVRIVHPYDSYWGRLLKKPLRQVRQTDSRPKPATSQ